MKIFISHDLKDNKEFIENITLELTHKGFDVYDITSNIKPSEKIEKNLEILKYCDAYLCIVSKNSAQSIKMQIEYENYIKNNIKINILPILIEQDMELPHYLKQYEYTQIKDLKHPNNEIQLITNKLNKIKLKPSVFICHSSKDKPHFVAKFIEDLKKFGVEPWYDDSEINSGSLIESIDKGIKNSDSGIIVFSKNLNESKFALMEMKSLIHKSIYDDYELIPVKIDDEVEIPELINHMQVIEIYDLKDYENELNKILQMIFKNKSNNFIKPEIIKIPNCSKKDTEIFLELCKLCLDYGFDMELDPENIFHACEKYFDENSDMVEEKIAASLKNLEKEGYLINEGGNIGRAFSSKKISQKGFCFYFNNFIEEQESKYIKLINAIFKNKKYSLDELVEETNLEREIIETLINIFRKHNYISCKNDLTILGITIEGKNYFENIIGE